MTVHVLDTDILSLYQRGHPVVCQHVTAHPATDLAITLPFPEPAQLRFEQLAAMKLNVRKMDLRIAAIALEQGAVVVTRNLRDFQRVPGLVVQDWTV